MSSIARLMSQRDMSELEVREKSSSELTISLARKVCSVTFPIILASGLPVENRPASIWE